MNGNLKPAEVNSVVRDLESHFSQSFWGGGAFYKWWSKLVFMMPILSGWMLRGLRFRLES